MSDPVQPEELNTYLWDRSGPPDHAVTDLEQALGPLAFDARQRPLALPRHHHRRWPIVTALAASVIVAAGVWFFNWRLEWPAGRAWSGALASAVGSQPASLAVGQTLSVPTGSTATFDIARLGAMRIAAGTEMTLNATSSRRHQLQMSRGTVYVRVWSPPGRIKFETPAGEVIDLGCIFTLTIDDERRSHIRVETGWVQMANAYGETLVPAGSSTVMSPTSAPHVPVFDDADDGFRVAVRKLESDGIDVDVTGALDLIDRTARRRDVLTLLYLAVRERGVTRSRLLERAAALAPPPVGTAAETVGSIDDAAIWRWKGTLPLPPAKSWVRNWPDLFRPLPGKKG